MVGRRAGMAPDPNFLANYGKKLSFGLLVAAFVFGGIGAYKLRTLTWSTTTGHVAECVARSVGDAKQPTEVQDCTVTWTADGATHIGQVQFDGNDPLLDDTDQKLSVNGDEAVASSVLWQGPLMVAVGLMFLVGSIWMFVARRRGA
jgi:hypothetical protein